MVIPFEFDIWSSLLAFGVLQGIFITIILYSYGSRTSVHALAGIILILVLSLLNYLLISSNLYSQFPYLIHVATPLWFLVGPLYFLYINSVAGSDIKIDIKKWYHLIPFILAVIFMTARMNGMR